MLCAIHWGHNATFVRIEIGHDEGRNGIVVPNFKSSWQHHYLCPSWRIMANNLFQGLMSLGVLNEVEYYYGCTICNKFYKKICSRWLYTTSNPKTQNCTKRRPQIITKVNMARKSRNTPALNTICLRNDLFFRARYLLIANKELSKLLWPSTIAKKIFWVEMSPIGTYFIPSAPFIGHLIATDATIIAKKLLQIK